MTIKKGSIGVPLRIATGFDMSGSTSLKMDITKPDGTVLTKTSGAGEVSAPAVALVNDPDLGSVDASKYLEYTNTVDDYDTIGLETDANPWKVCGQYVDATQTLPVSPVPFTVLPGC
jgi:hypothetical protein